MSKSKVVILTGASRGIGRQLAVDCARHGMAVAVNYRSRISDAQEVVDMIEGEGGRAMLVQCDVSRGAEVKEMVVAVVSHFGRIDCLINNAGVGNIVELENLDEEEFEKTIRVNLTSAFLVSQAVIPYMKEQGGGRLIFMSSTAARVGGLISAAYASSKAGMEGLMHYYANYLLGQKITANAIAPALIESDMVRQMTLPPPSEMPLGRLGRPEELWPVVRMLIETEYITGQTIHLNAGRYMT